MVKKDDLKEEFSKRLTAACLEAGVGGRGLPGRMRAALKKSGISISEPGIWKWLNAASIPDPTNILALSRWLGVRAEWLEYGRGSMREDGQSVIAAAIADSEDAFKIEVLDMAVSAGPGCVNNYEFVEIVRSIEYSPEEAKQMFGNRSAADIKLINVKGDSMTGTIEPGDLLFVDTTVHSFDGDGIYAFLYDDTAHVKRLQKIKDKLLVLSDNKSYHPWDPIERDEMNRVYIYGKVIGSMPQTYRRHG
ncbi:LexA family transcriptional regulator [Serratia fonticola]